MVPPQAPGAQASAAFAMEFNKSSHSTTAAAQYITNAAVGVLGNVEPPFSPLWSKVKNILGFLIFLIDMAVLAVCPYGVWLIKDVNDTQGGIGLFSAAMPFAFVSAIWVAADLATQMRRGVDKPIAPGVQIAYHSISFLSMSIVASLWTAYSVHWETYEIEQNLAIEIYYYGKLSYYSDFYRAQIVVHKVGIAGLSLLYTAAMFHFILFVRACIDTQHELTYKKAVKFVELVKATQLQMGQTQAPVPNMYSAPPVPPKPSYEMHQVPIDAVELPRKVLGKMGRGRM